MIAWVLLCTPVSAQMVETLTDEFGASGDVAVGPDGAVYVGDFGEALGSGGINGENVYRVTLDGRVEVFASGFVGASGNSFDAESNLYQSDILNQRIVKITPDGTTSTFVQGDFQGVIGNTFDAEGNLYFNECDGRRVQKASPDGGTVSIFATSPLFQCPNGLTTGPDGNLYAVNFADGKVLKIAVPEGEVSELVTLPGGGNGHITSANDRLYVASIRGHQVFEVTLGGEFRVLAGTGEEGNTDGPADQATLYKPNGIAASVTGDTLYFNTTVEVTTFAQLHPNVVRMVTGVLETIVDAEDGATDSQGTRLLPLYPNPAVGVLSLPFTQASPGLVRVEVFDLLGRRVATLVDEVRPAGSHVVRWEGVDARGRRAVPGSYVFRLTTDHATMSRTGTLLW